MAHKDKLAAAAYQRAWYLAHRDKRVAYARAWRLANPGKCAAYGRTWDLKNRNKVAAYSHAWWLANPDKRKEYRVNRLDKNLAYNKAWWSANPDKSAEYAHGRRAHRLGNGKNDLSSSQIKAIRRWGFCSYCGVRAKMVVDHVVSLKRGGANTLSNVVPACQPCNSKKGASTWVPTWPATIEARA